MSQHVKEHQQSEIDETKDFKLIDGDNSINQPLKIVEDADVNHSSYESDSFGSTETLVRS